LRGWEAGEGKNVHGSRFTVDRAVFTEQEERSQERDSGIEELRD